MYMSDLSEYSYRPRYVRPGLFAVGWLDESHPFPKGNAPVGLLERLWAFCERRIAQTRGYHECPWCSDQSGRPVLIRLGEESVVLGDAEIRVFSTSGMAFAAPNLIYHYVGVHRYLPPQPFLDAALTGPLPGSTMYEEWIQQYAIYDDLFGWR